MLFELMVVQLSKGQIKPDGTDYSNVLNRTNVRAHTIWYKASFSMTDSTLEYGKPFGLVET